MARLPILLLAATLPLLAVSSLASATMPRMQAPMATVSAMRLQPAIERPQRPDESSELNRAIDARLGAFASANAGNSQALAALEVAASQIGQHPAAFIDQDGTPNQAALAGLLTRTFSSAGEVVIPAAEAVGGTGSSVAEMGDQDIMALAVLVMMESSRSARDDLKAVLDEIQASNRKKAALRESTGALRKRATGCVGQDVDCATAKKDKPDGLTEWVK